MEMINCELYSTPLLLDVLGRRRRDASFVIRTVGNVSGKADAERLSSEIINGPHRRLLMLLALLVVKSEECWSPTQLDLAGDRFP